MTAKVRFLHIPKTAGSTLDECLFLLYLRPYVLRRLFVLSGDFHADKERLAAMSGAQRRRIELCLGHAPLRTGCPEIDTLPTITLLRNPVARVQSFCQHVSEGKSPQLYDPRDGKAFDLDAFLDSGRLQLNDFQSRIVLGNEGYQLPRGDPAELARRAVDTLASQFACFGITEELDRSLLLFKQVLGWQAWPVYRSRNVGNPAARLHFEARHIAAIEALNRVDLAMYEMARGQFQQRLEECCPRLETDLPRFRLALASSRSRFVPIDLARLAGRWRRALGGSPDPD